MEEEEEEEAKAKANNVEKFIVGSVPTLMYIPDFITQHHQALLLNTINSAPPVSKWKSLKNRRLQNWGGVVHEKGLLSQQLPPWLTKVTDKIYQESALFPAPINHVLINEYLPNQGIMAHQDGPAYFPVVAILSLGSPVVMDFTPHARFRLDTTNTSTVDVKEKSLDEEALETGKDSSNYHPFSVLLMPRSLLIFKDAAYSDFLHGIRDNNVHCFDGVVNEAEAQKIQKEPDAELSRDLKSVVRTTNRISLTCRLVFKAHKNLFKF